MIVGKAMPTVLSQVKAAKGLKTVSVLYDVKNNFYRFGDGGGEGLGAGSRFGAEGY